MADDEVPDWAVSANVGPRGELFLRDESGARLVALAVTSADLDVLVACLVEQAEDERGSALLGRLLLLREDLP